MSNRKPLYTTAFASPPSGASAWSTTGPARFVRLCAAVGPAGPAPMTTTAQSGNVSVTALGYCKMVGRTSRTVLQVACVALGVCPGSGRIDPRTALLERGGWEALRSGHTAAAVVAFREALTADPRNARLHLGAAMAAALEQRDEDAKAACERALEIEPGLLEARALLGQVLYRMRDVASAIRVYEILASNGSDSGMAKDDVSVDRWRRDASCTIACSRPSDRISPCRSKDRLKRSSPREPSRRSTMRTGESGNCLACTRANRYRSCCTPRSNFRTSRDLRRGRRRVRRDDSRPDARSPRQRDRARTRPVARVHARSGPDTMQDARCQRG